MSPSCKIVKGISLLALVLAIASVVVGVIALVNAGDTPAELGGINAAYVTGAVAIVAGILEFATGLMGARGANNPSKMGPFMVLAWIMVVVNLGEVALTVMGGAGTVWVNVLYAVVAAVAAVYAARAKKEAEHI